MAKKKPFLGPRFFWPLAVAVCVAAASLAYLRMAGARPYRRTDYLLGTLIEITAYGPKARTGAEAAFAAMRRIDRLADPRRPASDVSRLARAAGGDPIVVDPETIEMLELAETWRVRSGGAFDATVAPLVSAWGFAPGGRPHRPDSREIQAALDLVDGRGIQLDKSAGTARLSKTGMAIDLGGMAKGYAVDRAYQELARAGVKSALINGGGSSIRVLGKPPHGGLWRIGVGHPRASGRMLAVLQLGPGEAIGTSADNQRFFIREGKRYSHLIDPRTGYPAQGAILFSVVGKSAVLTDIISTAGFVLGESGLALAGRAGTQALIYTAARRLMTTSSLAAVSLAP